MKCVSTPLTTSYNPFPPQNQGNRMFDSNFLNTNSIQQQQNTGMTNMSFFDPINSNNQSSTYPTGYPQGLQAQMTGMQPQYTGMDPLFHTNPNFLQSQPSFSQPSTSSAFPNVPSFHTGMKAGTNPFSQLQNSQPQPQPAPQPQAQPSPLLQQLVAPFSNLGQTSFSVCSAKHVVRTHALTANEDA